MTRMRINPYDATSRFRNRFGLAYLTWWLIYAAVPIAVLVAVFVALF